RPQDPAQVHAAADWRGGDQPHHHRPGRDGRDTPGAEGGRDGAGGDPRGAAVEDRRALEVAKPVVCTRNRCTNETAPLASWLVGVNRSDTGWYGEDSKRRHGVKGAVLCAAISGADH